MPASEQIWRNPKRMHLFFAISSVLMLLTTIWMLAADHHREWKAFQRTFRDVETWSIESRIQQQENEEYEQKVAKSRAALEEAEHEVPPAELVEAFKQTLIKAAEDREAHAAERRPDRQDLPGSWWPRPRRTIRHAWPSGASN